MSAEVETNKEEETKEEPKKLKHKFRQHWQVGIKIVELLLCFLCIGSASDAIEKMGIGSSDLHHIGVMYTAYTGYILINVTLLLNNYLQVVVPYKTSSLFSICGAGLFLTTGVLLLVDKSDFVRHYGSPPTTLQQSMLMVSVTFAFVNSAVFTLLCAACVGFIYEPANSIHLGKSYLHHTGIMYTAYTGYMLINLIFLVGRAIGDRIPFATILLFAINGVWLFTVTGILLTVDRVKLSGGIFHPRQYQLTMMTISISCSFANAFVFAVEAFFTYARRQDL